MSERIVFECATTTTVRSSDSGSASSHIAWAIRSLKQSITRAWQSARLSVSGAGGACQCSWPSPIGGGLPSMLRRHVHTTSSPNRESSVGSHLR